MRRTRPNGDPRSFPSGHASATFATATVLHRHYGWKLGLPFYLLGVYTAASRIQDKKHWLTDTVMGATSAWHGGPGGHVPAEAAARPA